MSEVRQDCAAWEGCPCAVHGRPARQLVPGRETISLMRSLSESPSQPCQELHARERSYLGVVGQMRKYPLVSTPGSRSRSRSMKKQDRFNLFEASPCQGERVHETKLSQTQARNLFSMQRRINPMSCRPTVSEPHHQPDIPTSEHCTMILNMTSEDLTANPMICKFRTP